MGLLFEIKASLNCLHGMDPFHSFTSFAQQMSQEKPLTIMGILIMV